MTNLYLLRRPLRDILNEWLERRDPVNPLKDRFDKEDRLFSTDHINYDRENAHTIGLSRVEKSPTSADNMPAIEFDPTRLTIIRHLGDDKSKRNIVLQAEWDGAICILKVACLVYVWSPLDVYVAF
ncbi:hypothetical protein EWM64_g8212 [Hericium alpestre]|uniref:Uncharacterized protein n=1 Tax=Hericium alpestre TaxID=135208 RepID=A0A4Y9ZNG5_9AGAM|nr:hypothetical protein EWM64_g8212 [Hericium alpestre]